MNKYLFLLSFCAIIASCTSNSNKTAISPDDSLMWNQNPEGKAVAIGSAPAPAVVPGDSTAAASTPTTPPVSTEVNTPPASAAPATAKATPAAKAPQGNGKALLSKSDCLACHQEQQKVVGPAYVDVAKKYQPTEANINQLVSKIINGGAGVWGQIPMSPHPTLSKDDARAMVTYILSIK